MLNSIYPMCLSGNNYVKPVNFTALPDNKIKHVSDKNQKMSDGEKILIGLGAVAALTLGGILVNKKLEINKLNKAIEQVKNGISNRFSINNSLGYDAIFDNKILQGYVDDAAKLPKNEQLKKLKEIQSTIEKDRGLAQGLAAKDKAYRLDISKLPKDVQAAINAKDQLKATEAYIKYCDNLFHKSKTAGDTVQNSIKNVFGKNTEVKPHTYDVSKECNRIATSCYTSGSGYTDVTVTSANQIADRLNFKNTIPTYSDIGNGLAQNAMFSIRKKTVNGKPVVTLVYRDALNKDAFNSIRLLSPDSKLTLAQRDLLKLKDCKNLNLKDFQTLTSSPERTNYDAILSTIKTNADKVGESKYNTSYDAGDVCFDCLNIASMFL